MTLGATRIAALEKALIKVGLHPSVDEPIGAKTTYRVGGNAALFITPSAVDDLLKLDFVLRSFGDIACLVLGNGSNMLVSEQGFAGLVVQLGAGFGYERIRDNTVTLGAGSSLPVAARRVAAAGVVGFEWAVGIPGTVGGAVRMNAGGHGSDIAANLQNVSLVGLGSGAGLVSKNVSELAFGYRCSNVGANEVVVEASFELDLGDPAASKERIGEIVSWRRANQPGGQNAGSVFTNPPGDHAARLIEAAGMKGFRYRTATVSPKHANFIQADPDGLASDVGELMAQVRDTVKLRFGIELTTEIRLVGFSSLFDFSPHH